MADFAAIRFQPSRPLLRELSADRLNSILAEIKRNRPLPGRGVTVRQTGQGTAIDLAASIPRGGGTSVSATLQPWDLISTSDPENENQYLVSVRPGTLNGFLPRNWDTEGLDGGKNVPCLDGTLYYAKAVITTDAQIINYVDIAIDINPPIDQEPQEFGVSESIEYLFGLFIDGQAYRVIADGHINISPKLWLTTTRPTPPQPGELPFIQYFSLR